MSQVNELIEKVKKSAAAELEYCNPVDTPAVCSLISTPAGKAKVIDLIVEYVGKSGISIGDAIVTIEREKNPTLNNE